MPTLQLRKQLEAPGTQLDSEVRALRRVTEYLSRLLPGFESCREAAKLRACLWSARQSLDRLESMVQSQHLSCCVIPEILGPGDLALGLARLGRRRYGAIVACENREPLDGFVARGVPLRLKVSGKALESLFAPGSRVGEGAAIVRGDLLIAAGVPLVPAQERTDENGIVLDERQRAALLLSRLTDALVFVVSEATGEIRVALDGHLRPLESP
jgi:diadenylate cyclase